MPKSNPLDKKVSPHLTGYKDLESAHILTPAARRKRDRDRKRIKVTWEMDPDLKQAINDIAAHWEVPPAHIATHLLAAGLAHWLGGGLDFADHFQPSRVPRYQWLLDLPDIPLNQISQHLKKMGG